MTALRPAAFVDRDGTLIVERNYLGDPAGVELIPGTAEALAALKAAGYAVVMLTNQSGVARGYFDMAAVERVHARLAELLAAGGAALDAVYTCPHGPNDACSCRKPLPGLARQAAADLGLDLARSLVFGDKAADLGVARAVGARGILVRTGHGAKEEPTAAPLADLVADDLAAAVRLILKP